MVVVSHDGNGTRTLGMTPKGVKAFEAFLLARQLMTRTVYFHHHVKVLEFMMEHFLQATAGRTVDSSLDDVQHEQWVDWR
jgi:HD superfamily phosphohydrolase